MALDVNESLSPYPYQSQLGSELCWAACASMVLEYYQQSVQQCTITGRFLQVDGCCQETLPTACDKSYPDSSISSIYMAYGGTAIYNNAAPEEGEIQGELKAHRPVEIKFSYDEGGGHVIMVFGFVVDDSGQAWYHVSDPNEGGRKDHTFADISSAFGLGSAVAYWSNISIP
jgi:hypothetical protein